ncbi:hypothetical protein C2S52_012344 [Perilla frutescens var. hirtella]|nr:hypothetical protein C2S52_012344 [Perilla frutescens var. hirtella]
MQKTDSEYYIAELIRNLLLVLIQAGSDTSSTTRKNRAMNESDVSELPYLDCVIKKTQCLHPPALLLLPHESSAESTVASYHVSSGTILLVNVWNIQRNPQVWEEREKFKPERFEDFYGSKNGCKYLPFESGRRACPGENLVMRVVVIALGSLIQCFDWEKVMRLT